LARARHDPAARWTFAQQTPKKSASFYKWRAKYGGMDAYMISQIKTLEDENRRQTDGLSM
jgi:hypothetical protein